MSVNIRLPCLFRQTTLHPVLKPGSTASMFLYPSGGVIRISRMFWAKTEIASSSALFFNAFLNSVSMDGERSRL